MIRTSVCDQRNGSEMAEIVHGSAVAADLQVPTSASSRFFSSVAVKYRTRLVVALVVLTGLIRADYIRIRREERCCVGYYRRWLWDSAYAGHTQAGFEYWLVLPMVWRCYIDAHQMHTRCGSWMCYPKKKWIQRNLLSPASARTCLVQRYVRVLSALSRPQTG